MRKIAAGEFKAKCLAIMDEVNATGQPVLVTKRGKPVARVVPPDEVPGQANIQSIFGSLRGLITLTVDPDELIEPMIPEEEWDHLRDNWSPFPQK